MKTTTVIKGKQKTASDVHCTKIVYNVRKHSYTHSLKSIWIQPIKQKTKWRNICTNQLGLMSNTKGRQNVDVDLFQFYSKYTFNGLLFHSFKVTGQTTRAMHVHCRESVAPFLVRHHLPTVECQNHVQQIHVNEIHITGCNQTMLRLMHIIVLI